VNGIDELINTLTSWFIGSVSFTMVIIIVILILVILGVLKIAQGILTKALLLLVVWLPSVVVANAVDISQLEPPPPVPLKGSSLLLFPYVWDTLFGYTGQWWYLVMLIMSYFALLHIAIAFVRKYDYNILWAPVVAYFMTISLGLGLINFHSYLYTQYANYCFANGFHPAVPPIFFALILAFIAIIKWYIGKRRGVSVSVGL